MNRRSNARGLTAILGVGLALGGAAASADAAPLPGAAGNGPSSQPAMSLTGRQVAFASAATNLVARDTNGKADVFVRDQQLKKTTRANVSATGAQANGASWMPGVSSDGRFVVFLSAATNLVPGDTNGQVDAFRKDLTTGQIIRISTSAAGMQANAPTTSVRISADGKRVLFVTAAGNLVTGDTGGQVDGFLKDLTAKTLVRVTGPVTAMYSLDAGQTGTPFVDLSPSGRVVGFSTYDPDPAVPGQYCGRAWIWDATSRTARAKSTLCADPEAAHGYPQVFAINDGYAPVRHDGWMSQTVTVIRPPAPNLTRAIEADCARDVSGWGEAIVDECSGNISFTGINGITRVITKGTQPVVSEDAYIVAFVDPSGSQIRAWNRRTRVVTLISQS